MDNKQDRKFYWEVSDFIKKSPNPETQKKTESLKDAVKNILEQKNIYKTNSFIESKDSVNIASKCINAIKQDEIGYQPKNISHNKTNLSNPFNLKEGWWDDFKGGLEAIGDVLTTRRTSKDWQAPAGISPEQARKNAAQNRSNVSFLERQAAGEFNTQDLPQLSSEIEAQNQTLTPGTPLGANERAKRDLEAQLQAEKNWEDEDMEMVQQEQDLQNTDWKDTWLNKTLFGDKNNQPQSQPTTPQPTTPQQTSAPATTAPPQQPPSSTTSASVDPEQEKYSQARTDAYKKQNLRKRQEAEQQLAALNALDDTKASNYMKATRARNKVRLQQEIEGSKDVSDAEIQRRAAYDTKQRFMSPEDKADKERKSKESSLAFWKQASTKITDPEQKASAQARIDELEKEVSEYGSRAPGTLGTTQQGPPSPVSSTKQTQSPTSSTTPTPGTAPAASTTKPTAIPSKPTPGTGTAPGSPSQTPSTMTGGQVNRTARETLGLGKEPEPTKTPTSGENAARETLGMGSSKPETQPESEAKKKARETLMR
jgi:hypothetical protein